MNYSSELINLQIRHVFFGNSGSKFLWGDFTMLELN